MQANDILPFVEYGYYVNHKDKRVFLLISAPAHRWRNWEQIPCKLLEWGKTVPNVLPASQLLELIETKALIPYQPKYV